MYIRGCNLDPSTHRWVLYEKPNFKGEKFALDEGEMELAYPFNQEEPLQNGETEAAQQNGGTSDAPAKPARKFIIGSLRRAVRVGRVHPATHLSFQFSCDHAQWKNLVCVCVCVCHIISFTLLSDAEQLNRSETYLNCNVSVATFFSS